MAEAKKVVRDVIQVDGHPELPRIKLRMSARNLEPATERLTFKSAGQTPEISSQSDQPHSGIKVDDESLKRQQDLVGVGSVSREADIHGLSPRTRSFRRQVGSPDSNGATTASLSKQSQGVPASGHDTTTAFKDETLSLSQATKMKSSDAFNRYSLDATNGIVSNDGEMPQLITHPF